MLLFWKDQPIAYSSKAHLHLLIFSDTVRVALVFYFWLLARLQYERMGVVVFNCFSDPYIVDVYVVCFLNKFDIINAGMHFFKICFGYPTSFSISTRTYPCPCLQAPSPQSLLDQNSVLRGSQDGPWMPLC